MTTIDRCRYGLLASLLMLVVAGCAAGPLPTARDIRPDDVKRLAGSWTWTEWGETPARLGSGPIKVRVSDGRLLFETSTTVGTLTLHEDSTKRVLAGEGRDRAGGRPFRVELTQRVLAAKAATAASRADSAPVVAVIVVE